VRGPRWRRRGPGELSCAESGVSGRMLHNHFHALPFVREKKAILIRNTLPLEQSILSTVYAVLHICAARKGDDLYLSPPTGPDAETTPDTRKKSHFFQHPLHAWAVIVSRMAFVGWASALTFSSVAVSRQGGARLGLDVFFAAVGV
jgi:hypothetical protein